MLFIFNISKFSVFNEAMTMPSMITKQADNKSSLFKLLRYIAVFTTNRYLILLHTIL